MTPLVTAEIVCAFVILIILIILPKERDRTKSDTRFTILSVVTILWCIIDSLSYIWDTPNTNNEFVIYGIHIISLLSYLMSNIVVICYFSYCYHYISSKTKISKITFEIPIGIGILTAIFDIVYYCKGHLVKYVNGSFENSGSLPVYILLIYVLMLLYGPVIAFIKRKEIGNKASILLACYSVPLLASTIILAITDRDYTVLAASLSCFFVIGILERDKILSVLEKEVVNETLKENNASMLALEDKFETMYDVDLETNQYTTYVKGQTFSMDVDTRMVYKEDFFEDTYYNLENVVYKEDKELIRRVFNKEYIINRLKNVHILTHIID